MESTDGQRYAYARIVCALSRSRHVTSHPAGSEVFPTFGFKSAVSGREFGISGPSGLTGLSKRDVPTRATSNLELEAFWFAVFDSFSSGAAGRRRRLLSC